MPGPHIELKLMQTFADVGACDAWMGSYWQPHQQWWVGWHSPNDISHWSWPSEDWLLIGYERWYYPRKGEPKLREAFYATPNPTTQPPPCPPPNGHWHVCYSPRGRETWRQWVGTPLAQDDQLYLKGGNTGPKGNFDTNGADKGKGKGAADKGKGKGTASKGKGKGGECKSKGKNKGKGKGKDQGTKGKGKGI